MKRLILFAYLAYSSSAIATPAITKQILKNKPRIDRKIASKIAQAVHMTSLKYKIKPKILTAILMQESSYRINAVNCSAGGCWDFGMSQINARTIAHYGFEIPKLMTDYSYSINAAGKVLFDFKKMYPKEAQYWTRYNTSKPTLRLAYYNNVTRWM